VGDVKGKWGKVKNGEFLLRRQIPIISTAKARRNAKEEIELNFFAVLRALAAEMYFLFLWVQGDVLEFDPSIRAGLQID
jgi:hypothetical protein